MDNKSRTLIGQIGWLSACILAAVWGPLISFEWRVTWSLFGVFGLIAAFGLQVVEKRQSAREERRRQNEANNRFSNRVAKLDACSQVKNQLAESVQRIIDDAEYKGLVRGMTTGRCGDDDESRTSCEIPARMTIQTEHDGEEEGSVEVYIRNISTNGIGLKHRERIDAHRIALEVDLDGDTTIRLVAALIWREPTDDGWYASGGKLVEATIKRCRAVPTEDSNEEQFQLLAESSA